VQLTTDGHHAYLTAVENAFESEVDYAQLVKIYGTPREGAVRYSPSTMIGTHSEVIRGNASPRSHFETGETTNAANAEAVRLHPSHAWERRPFFGPALMPAAIVLAVSIKSLHSAKATYLL
jgi:hypothetical protein